MFAQKSLVVAPKASARSVQARAGAPAYVPDMDKRNTMNALLLAGAALPVGALGVSARLQC